MIEIGSYLEWQEVEGGTMIAACGAEWCPPCKAIEPSLKKLEELGHKVYHIDIDKNDIIASKFGVRSIPLVLFFKDGQVIDQINGAVSQERFLAAAEKIK